MSTRNLFYGVKAKPKLVQVLKQLRYLSNEDEIAERLGWSWYWVAISLRELASVGLADKVGEGYYHLTDEGKKVLDRIEAMERLPEV